MRLRTRPPLLTYLLTYSGYDELTMISSHNLFMGCFPK